MVIKKIYIYTLFLIFQRGILCASEVLSKSDQIDFYSKNDTEEKYFPITKVQSSTFFTLGALESPISSEALHFTYENKIRLNTSFTGKDNLFTIFESGNAMSSPLNLDLQSKKGDYLKISSLFYKFNLGDELQVSMGPKMFGYNGLSGKSTAYSERFAILDGSNFTTSAGIGPGFAISKEKDNGLNATIKLASNNSSFKKESTHLISQIGLTKRIWGGTITNNINDKFHAYGVAAFYKPNNFPSLSASIEKKDENGLKTKQNWVIGLQKIFENKKIGLAVGTHNEDEKIAYEGWSEINISDNLKIIPVFFIRENISRNADLGFSINTKFNY